MLQKGELYDRNERICELVKLLYSTIKLYIILNITAIPHQPQSEKEDK